MPKEIVGEEEITLPQVKKLLSKRGKESELSFQQSITLEHASTFAKMAPAVAAKLVARLMKNYELTKFQAVQIVNIAPINIEVRASFCRRLCSKYHNLLILIDLSKN